MDMLESFIPFFPFFSLFSTFFIVNHATLITTTHVTPTHVTFASTRLTATYVIAFTHTSRKACAVATTKTFFISVKKVFSATFGDKNSVCHCAE
jgi:hypothetical protein